MDDVSILATPIPDEKDFRDYILVFPENVFPPIYVYLSENKISYAHGYKHYPPKGLSWGEVVKTTKSGPAKFKPNVDITSIDYEVWENGISTSNEKNWKIMKFDEVKGAYKGKETAWVVTKESQGTIHSHPIGEQEARRLMK
ncbi:S-type pyocin domain-containing protein [Brenneria roseae]|uniref:S-type pyocin domain-containing protein n=1 Tax=Brenneria roseae TaxID=1509241 RepID=UPI0024902075|nr:S-type pyocin domain-containing protein [Brenneria roseae]